MPYSGFHHHGRFVDPTHTAVLDYSGSSHVTVYDLLAGKTNTKAVLAPPKEGPHGWQRHSCNSWSSNSRWGVIAYLPDSEDATSCDNNAVTSFAAIVPIGSVLGGCCACEREGGGEESRSFVVVKMPLFVGGGANLLQLRMQVQMDECAASEAIITQYTESVVAIVVVDVESTYRSGKSLVVLSATKWEPIPLLDGFKVDRVYQVTNSLFCVSFRTSGLHGKKLAVYHCDDVNHPTLVLAGERGETTPPCRFTAQGGFIFKVLSDKIVVLEPFQGNTVLTIHFPGFKRWVSLMTTPFSCFLSSSQY
ncbi:hypothetical protein Pelo_19158 [Pelomyxa schiedti]|nr:hypothetical protein Pelo_19158 [Pelomyxa schiedti]